MLWLPSVQYVPDAPVGEETQAAEHRAFKFPQGGSGASARTLGLAALPPDTEWV